MRLDPDTIQGNILRGYRRGLVRHLMLEVQSRPAARAFLAAAVGGGTAEVPDLTSDSQYDQKPDYCFNIGLTFAGLAALGVPQAGLASFPAAFVQGMAKRAMKLGDFGAGAPGHWPAPFDRPERIHLIATIHADQPQHLDRIERMVGAAFTILGRRDGRALPEGKVFFGYRDGIEQPRFYPPRPEDGPSERAQEPLGTALLGHKTRIEGIFFAVPSPHVLGHNGSFNAFRVLAQDVHGFDAYLSEAAQELDRSPAGEALLPKGEEGRIGPGLSRTEALAEIVAAQICGRWRNGTPYETSPRTPCPAHPVSLTDFDYTSASACPAGAHIRRTNPRGGPIVQRIANHTRRLIRRGMSYGPDYSPGSAPDGQERGLLGSFIGADLAAQFEAVMCDWLNLGLQDPNITGSNDPMVGANSAMSGWFDLRLPAGQALRLRNLPQFVTTRGGAYTFLPSLPAIRYLSQLRD